MSDKLSVYRAWVNRAMEDVHTCELLLAANADFDNICLLSQQAAEKYLKAFMAYQNQDIEFIHDLVKLAGFCANKEPKFAYDIGALQTLTKYAIEGRYDVGHPATVSEAERANQIALTIIQEVKKFLPS